MVVDKTDALGVSCATSRPALFSQHGQTAQRMRGLHARIAELATAERSFGSPPIDAGAVAIHVSGEGGVTLSDSFAMSRSARHIRQGQHDAGELVVYGTPEEWHRCAAGLDDLTRDLKHDVLRAADNAFAHCCFWIQRLRSRP